MTDIEPTTALLEGGAGARQGVAVRGDQVVELIRVGREVVGLDRVVVGVRDVEGVGRDREARRTAPADGLADGQTGPDAGGDPRGRGLRQIEGPDRAGLVHIGLSQARHPTPLDHGALAGFLRRIARGREGDATGVVLGLPGLDERVLEGAHVRHVGLGAVAGEQHREGVAPPWTDARRTVAGVDFRNMNCSRCYLTAHGC